MKLRVKSERTDNLEFFASRSCHRVFTWNWKEKNIKKVEKYSLEPSVLWGMLNISIKLQRVRFANTRNCLGNIWEGRKLEFTGGKRVSREGELLDILLKFSTPWCIMFGIFSEAYDPLLQLRPGCWVLVIFYCKFILNFINVFDNNSNKFTK